ncbi:protein unc-93 homolog A-like [Ylistrum balloti]|uniref:protein unc-93 homolog A-like n=1 Tax=Ylistrum balloti TaxID=509963 RepID=UPI0029058DAB|nr:protein unc-93 homolog A-like [Ylistrum balloti]
MSTESPERATNSGSLDEFLGFREEVHVTMDNHTKELQKLSHGGCNDDQDAVTLLTNTVVADKAKHNPNSERNPDIEVTSNSLTVSSMTKNQIMKNLSMICTSFFLMFTSFHSMLSLLTSLSKEEGMGTFAIFIECSFFMISAMFLASFSIDRFGVKLTLFLSTFTTLSLMAANLYPVWAIMVPASIVCGLGAGPMWASQSAYVSELSKHYANITQTKLKDSLSFFFGIFFMSLNGSKITGNLLSSLLLKQNTQANTSMTLEEIEDCVANKQEAVSNATSLERPDDMTIYTICGTWIGIASLGIVVSAFLSPVTIYGDEYKDGKREAIYSKFLASTKHFWNSRLQKILIPLSMYYGISNGFLIADFTKSIVGCTLGIQTVGDVMLCSGILNTVSAVLVGPLTKHFGHLPFFTIAFLCFGGVQVSLLIWKPGPENGYPFFIFGSIWGVADAILKIQVMTIYGHLFADNIEAAYGSYFMLEAAGFITSTAYSVFLSTDVKLYILLSFLVCSAISYYTVEYIDRKQNKRQDVEQ